MKYATFLLGLLLIAPLYARAADPSVASFIAGSYSLRSGQSASFSWSVANAGGYSFIIPCTVGLKFKRTNGTVFPCDTLMPSTLTAIDGIDLSVWNLSGTSKSFTARVIPKDALGADFFSGHRDVSVAIDPVTNPIESMGGATAASSSAPYTLSWVGGLIDGVNLSISCGRTVRTTSSLYPRGDTPCNTPLFAGGLPASGSLVLSFDNDDVAVQNITLTLTPMMAPSIYNGLQTESITVAISSNIAPEAMTTAFATSANLDRIPEGSPVPFSWTTSAATGSNIRFSCNEHIAIAITAGSASSTPKCATLAFAAALPANGTGTIIFSNDNFASESITAILVPARANGGFDATRGKELSFRVLPKGVPVAVPATTNIKTQTTALHATTAIVPAKKVFTKSLVRGTSGAEVRALQEFLKKDSTLYPEGIVNGVYGPATERAVKRLQVKYKLGNQSTPGYGGVGPITRGLLNSLVK
ncbi:MAG: peptidoglycan-binding protein [Candidatus Yonathbacteria bacterium]|nr:peptidoglycan-binding protein [Candidatus Yonathbacteria bacterium]